MIKVYCNGTRIQCLRQGELNVGMVGAPVEFDFSSEWDGLAKTAVFRCDGERDMIIGADGKTTVPYEILTTPGMDVEVGVYAVKEDGTTWPAPTTYCKIGRVGEGADPSVDGSYPPTPDVGEQAIETASKALQAAAEAQEVAADIQRRADSGEFDGTDGDDYVLTEADKDYIADLVAERVDVSLELDTTLTQSGKAADAKAVGDALENVGGKAYVQNTEPAQMEVGEFWYNPDEEGGSIPTTLPNPHKLTFSGAVNAEYDGSEAVEVVIPQGGGGGASEWELIDSGEIEAGTVSLEFNGLEKYNEVTFAAALIRNADGKSSGVNLAVNGVYLAGGGNYFIVYNQETCPTISVRKVAGNRIICKGDGAQLNSRFNQNSYFEVQCPIPNNGTVLESVKIEIKDAGVMFTAGSTFELWGRV